MTSESKAICQNDAGRELSDNELALISGGDAVVMSNLANMRHEMIKAVAQTLRA